MNPKKELSDKITELYNLRKGEFNEEIHLPFAEFIVDKLGKDSTYLVSAADLFTFENDSIKIDHETEGVGLYVVRHQGRLKIAGFLGFHPKLEITHWKSEYFLNNWDKKEKLDISYEGKKVKGIMKSTDIPHSISLGKLALSYIHPKKQWLYRR